MSRFVHYFLVEKMVEDLNFYPKKSMLNSVPGNSSNLNTAASVSYSEILVILILVIRASTVILMIVLVFTRIFPILVDVLLQFVI